MSNGFENDVMFKKIKPALSTNKIMCNCNVMINTLKIKYNEKIPNVQGDEVSNQ